MRVTTTLASRWIDVPNTALMGSWNVARYSDTSVLITVAVPWMAYDRPVIAWG